PEAGEGQLPVVVPREPRERRRLRPRGSARRARALRRRPEPDQHDPHRSRQGDDRRRAAGGEEIPGASEPNVDRSPPGGRRPVREERATLAIVVSGFSRPVMALAFATTAVAQERPAVGPERPFQLAPRVERTLP